MYDYKFMILARAPQSIVCCTVAGGRMRTLFLDGRILEGEGTMTHTVVAEAMKCGPIYYKAGSFKQL